MWSREFGRIAAPIFVVFAVQPRGSVEFPPVLTNSWSKAFSQTSASELCPYFCSSSLAMEVPVPIARGTDSVSLRVSCATP